MEISKTKECQFCQSEISIKADKCRFCLEWQDEIQDSKSFKNETVDSKILNYLFNFNKPFQLFLIEKIPLQYFVTIFITCTILFGSIQIAWYKLDEERIYLLSFLFFTFQLMISWSALIWVYKILIKNSSAYFNISSKGEIETKTLFAKYQRIMFNNKNAILFGISVGIIASLGDFLIGAPFKSNEAKIIFAVYEFVYMFFAGAAIYSMLVLAYFIYILGSKNEISDFNLIKKQGINTVGSLHLKTSIIAIVPLLLSVIAKFFGDWNWHFLVVIWYVSFAVIILVYIYWPMLNIHKIMSEDIDNQVFIIKNKIQKTLREINKNPSSKNFSKLNELRKLEDSISNQNSWPFDTKSVSAAFAAVIFPIILIIIDKIWNI